LRKDADILVALMKLKTKSLIKAIFLLTIVMSLCLYAEEISVKIIENPEELAETFCSIGREGDILVSDGKATALIGGSSRPQHDILNYPAGNTTGSVISFSPTGKKLQSTLAVGTPRIVLREKRKYIRYHSVERVKEIEEDGVVCFRAAALLEGNQGERAEITTLYRFVPGTGKIDITSSIKNTGQMEIQGFDYSLHCDALHEYSFNPFDREKHPNPQLEVYQKKGHYLGVVDFNAPKEKDELQPGKLLAGQSFNAPYILITREHCNDLLREVYALYQITPRKAMIHIENQEGRMIELIIRDAFSSFILYRAFLENPLSTEVLLPEGYYSVQANFFPAVCEESLKVATDGENKCVLVDPAKGKVKVRILNSSKQYIPGKVTFIGLGPTRSPYFMPENPVESGREWEKMKNSCFPGGGGKEVLLPIGTYLLSASRGPEYTRNMKIVEVLEGEAQDLIFIIDKVLETEGLISLDPHVHTLHSDGSVGIAERIRSLVAEGVEVAVASDHNLLISFAPKLKELGLNEVLVVLVGNEITTSRMIHYNTYPLVYSEAEDFNGAIDPFSEEVTALFNRSRRKDPGAVLQVNHPRDRTLGYFNNYHLDPENASSAQVGFDTSFDVLEVMNGPSYYSSNYQAIADWLHLLNRGYYFPIVASSDSHSIDEEVPGYSRTYVYYSGPKGEGLDDSSLIHSIKKGRSFISNGPVVEFTARGTYLPGDTLTAPEGKLEIQVKVQSAPWISVDEVRIIINGERKIAFKADSSDKEPIKFAEKISLKLNEDSYVIAEVLGKKSLFPVIQATARAGLLEKAVLPYALTNPIFVDVDGNGKFDPPWPEKIKLLDNPYP